MAFTTYTPKASATVKAQTITAIGNNLAKRHHSNGYTLADGSFVSSEGIANKLGAGYVPKVGDYLVLNASNNLVIWPAALFTQFYS